MSAGTSSGAGTPAPRRVRLTPAAQDLGARKPASSSACLPVVGEHEVDERLRGLGVRGVGEDADRVLVDRLLRLRELDALDGVARALHVRGVDQGGVDLAQFDLGEGRADVLLLGVGHRRDAGRLEDLLRGRAARHVRRADGQGELLAREVGEPGDAARIADGHGDLQHVLGEDRRLAVGQVGVGDHGHLGLVGRGEHVDRRALGDLGGQRRAAGEVELDVQVRVVGHQLVAELAEDVGERGGREDRERAGQLAARGRRRPDAVVVGRRRAAARGECHDRREGQHEQGTRLHPVLPTNGVPIPVRICGTLGHRSPYRASSHGSVRICAQLDLPDIGLEAATPRAATGRRR